MGQGGVPLFYLQALKGIGFTFKDLFNDGSLFWSWVANGMGAGKTRVEAGGEQTIAIAGGTLGEWSDSQNNCPKISIAPCAYPCEIVTKITSLTLGDECQAGLIFSNYPHGFGSDVWFGFVRRKHPTSPTTPFDGIAVVTSDGAVNFSLANTTLPVWFKMRLGQNAYQSTQIQWYYSYDGMNYTHAFSSGWAQFSRTAIGISLAVMNSADGVSTNAISCGFDYFTMKPKSIN